MSTKSKARAARRAHEKHEHEQPVAGDHLTERERTAAAELARALLTMITFGALSDDGPSSRRAQAVRT